MNYYKNFMLSFEFELLFLSDLVWIASILKMLHLLQSWILLTLILSVFSFGDQLYCNSDFMFISVSESDALFWKLHLNYLDSIDFYLGVVQNWCNVFFYRFLNYFSLPVSPCHTNLNPSFTVA